MIIKCPNCKHEWDSKSKLGIVICASCGKKIIRKNIQKEGVQKK